MARVSINNIRNHVDRLIPEGDYEVKFVKAEDKVAQTEREWIQLTCEFKDTIPSGQPIDRETYVDPMAENKKLTKGVFFPMDKDKEGTIDMFMSTLKKLMEYSDCQPADEEQLVGADLMNLYCGVRVRHVPINKDDKDSDLKAEISTFVPLP